MSQSQGVGRKTIWNVSSGWLPFIFPYLIAPNPSVIHWLLSPSFPFAPLIIDCAGSKFASLRWGRLFVKESRFKAPCGPPVSPALLLSLKTFLKQKQQVLQSQNSIHWNHQRHCHFFHKWTGMATWISCSEWTWNRFCFARQLTSYYCHYKRHQYLA